MRFSRGKAQDNMFTQAISAEFRVSNFYACLLDEVIQISKIFKNNFDLLDLETRQFSSLLIVLRRHALY